MVIACGVVLAAWKHTAMQNNAAASANQPEPMEVVTAAVAKQLDQPGGQRGRMEAQRAALQRLAVACALVGTPDPHNPVVIPVAQVKQWEQAGIVEWWGWRDDMQEVYRQSHIVCLPSYREGLP